MSGLSRAIAGTGVIGGSYLLGQLLALARQVLVARALGPNEFGLGVAFFVVIALIEMVADLGVNRVLLQGQGGDDPRLQSALHFVQVVRGLALAVLVATTGHAMASLFERPDAAWAFSSLAVVPLLRGFYHSDMARVHRAYRFGPQAKVEVAYQLVPLIVAWPLAAWDRTYATVMYLIVLQTVVYLVASHFVAERRFSCRYDRLVTRTAMRLGWPLLISGALIFTMSQGERVLVIRVYGDDSLAFWGVAAMLAAKPAGVFARVANIVGMPFLAHSASADPQQYRARVRRYMSLTAGAAIGGIVPLVLVGDRVLNALYGSAYGAASVLMPAFAAGQAARLARGSVNVAALSALRTATPMVGNVIRASALGLMAWLTLQGASLTALAVVSACAEGVAVLGAAAFASRRGGVPAAPVLLLSGGVVALAGAAVVLHALLPGRGLGRWVPLGVGTLLAGCTGVWMIIPALDPSYIRRALVRVSAVCRAVV